MDIQLQPESFVEVVEVTLDEDSYATVLLCFEPSPTKPLIKLIEDFSLLPKNFSQTQQEQIVKFVLNNNDTWKKNVEEIKSYLTEDAFMEEMQDYLHFTL